MYVRRQMVAWVDIENAYLDGLLVETQARLLVDEEVFDLEAVVALELDHLSHALGLGVTDDGAIAGWVAVSTWSLSPSQGVRKTYQTPS